MSDEVWCPNYVDGEILTVKLKSSPHVANLIMQMFVKWGAWLQTGLAIRVPNVEYKLDPRFRLHQCTHVNKFSGSSKLTILERQPPGFNLTHAVTDCAQIYIYRFSNLVIGEFTRWRQCFEFVTSSSGWIVEFIDGNDRDRMPIAQLLLARCLSK